MSMKQLCEIADSFNIYRKGGSFACNAFGGDKGKNKVQCDRKARKWYGGGKSTVKFVLISAVEEFFKEECLDWN